MPKRRDGRQHDGTLAVTEHVGVEASTGQTRVALAYCHTTRRVAERVGSKVKRSKGQKVSYTFPICLYTLLLRHTRMTILRNKHDDRRILYERGAVIDPVV